MSVDMKIKSFPQINCCYNWRKKMAPMLRFEKKKLCFLLVSSHEVRKLMKLTLISVTENEQWEEPWIKNILYDLWQGHNQNTYTKKVNCLEPQLMDKILSKLQGNIVSTKMGMDVRISKKGQWFTYRFLAPRFQGFKVDLRQRNRTKFFLTRGSI